MEESEAICALRDRSALERFEQLASHLRKQGRIMDDLFGDLRRSRALFQLRSLFENKLIEEREMAELSEETRDWVLRQ